MTRTDRINRLDHAINQLAVTEAKIKAERMALTALRDEERRQLRLLIDHIMDDILDQPTPDDVAEATEYLYGDGMTASEAYLQHVADSFDSFDIEQGADL